MTISAMSIPARTRASGSISAKEISLPEFEIDTGLCIGGPCKDKSLEPIALAVVDGEVCICGVDLEESGIPDPFDEGDDTMEIMIHPE